MAKKTPTKIISKKHLARQERERQQTRLISGVAIGVVAIVILLIAYGLLNDTLFLRWRRAVTVNGESLTMQEFQVRVRATRQSLIGQYMQYVQLGQMLGVDPNSDSQMSQALSQISSELDSATTIGSQVIDDMVNDLLIRQFAKANGIVVTQADVDKAMQDAIGILSTGNSHSHPYSHHSGLSHLGCNSTRFGDTYDHTYPGANHNYTSYLDAEPHSYSDTHSKPSLPLPLHILCKVSKNNFKM